MDSAPKFPYDVVVTDMDGTLLTPDCVVSEFTKRVLQQLTAKGVPLILATGRGHPDVLKVREDLQLPVPDDIEHAASYIVTSNGSRVHYAFAQSGDASKGLVMEHNLAPEIALQLATLLKPDEEEVNLNFYQRDSWMCHLDWEDQLQYHLASGFRYDLFKPHDLANEWRAAVKETEANPSYRTASGETADELLEKYFGKVAKVFFGSDDTERLLRMEKEIAEQFGEHVSVTSSSEHIVEIMPKGVNKYSSLCEMLHRGRKASGNEENELPTYIAFGDGMNDMEMLQHAKKACIMSNAQQRLNLALPDVEVIGSNAEDAVAKRLIEVFNLDVPLL